MKLSAIISLTSCLILSSCMLAPGPQARGYGHAGGPVRSVPITVGVGLTIGTTTTTLPHKYSPVGSNRYYYDGVFYQNAPKGYVVITAPIGIRVNQIPANHKVIQYQGLSYFESKGIWYRYFPAPKQYQVVKAPLLKKRR